MRRTIAGIAGLLCGVSLFAAENAGVWLDVPFVKQDRDGCGAASLAMVMQYWEAKQGRPVTASAQYAAIAGALLRPDAKGIYASAMRSYLEQNGFRALAFAGDMQLMRHHLEKGRPLIVAIEPGRHVPLHYVVVAGIDPADGAVLVNDPAQRKLLKEETSRFEEEWKDAGYWTLLAVPSA